GFATDYTDIIITGGKVTARGETYTGTTASAGIGGSCHSHGKISINIKAGLRSSGMVDAKSKGSSSTVQDIVYGHYDSWSTPPTLTMNLVDSSLDEAVTRTQPQPPSAWVEEPCTLREISQFYNASGAFLLNQPQTITINQGDGKSASVMLYANDTIYDAAKKINDAIAYDLNQSQYANNSLNFCSIADGTANTSESVFTETPVYNGQVYETDAYGHYVLQDPDTGERYFTFGEPASSLKRLYPDLTDEIINRLEYSRASGAVGNGTHATMLIRSAVAGKAGELTFSSSSQDLLNALGLNTIQSSRENIYSANISDAHSGSIIASGVKFSGNKLSGIIHKNLDLEFDANSGIKALWNEASKKYILTSNNNTYTETLHLVDRGITFQTGANQGEDMFISIGDASTRALGIDNINVADRNSAVNAWKSLDNAYRKVSAQRAKIGAYTNSLEQTAANISAAALNLTQAESRIRDADMAQEMMNFVKLQILNQSGTSMLAQANQLPQAMLSLLQ
ncbi:MAG: hypothetical protein IJ576_09030, partial [Synergistaceae bacterium]|nr:hypothetical protein [Synergistaceae bacterium]